jgi:HK97 gp10 family phage protein
MARMIGLEQLVARLEKLPAAIRKAVEDQVQAEADQLVGALRRAAPVSGDLEARPGELRDSIEAYEVPGNQLRRRIIVGARDRKGRLYGRYVEFGHTGPGGKYVPASPFFFPTYRAQRKGIRRRIGQAVRRAIKAQFPESR